MKEIIFKKSLEQRWAEYNDIFNTFRFIYPIKKKWQSYVELTTYPAGWRALWKLSRLTCKKHNITYPTEAVVKVVNVDVETLTALVEVFSVSIVCESTLPIRNNVTLIELWPTHEQDSQIDNINRIANSLDVLRFFYLYLYFPWEEEDDDNDWREKHLESRLKFYHGVHNGSIPRYIAHRIPSLIEEANCLQTTKEILTREINAAENLKLEGKVLFIKSDFMCVYYIILMQLQKLIFL